MKKIYQHPQTNVVNIFTATPLQGSGLPSYIQDPGMSSTPSGARAAESTIWEDPEEETRKSFNDDEEDFE